MAVMALQWLCDHMNGRQAAPSLPSPTYFPPRRQYPAAGGNALGRRYSSVFMLTG